MLSGTQLDPHERTAMTVQDREGARPINEEFTRTFSRLMAADSGGARAKMGADYELLDESQMKTEGSM